jgi:hypothetical protein
MSGPSGNAMDCTEGEARRMDDSYVSSVSGAHRDSRIEVLVGLAVRREGVRVLGVDSVIKDEVVGSVSGGPMGEEGPGKGGTTDPADLGAETRDPEGTLNTDSGSWVSLAIVIVDADGVLVPMSEGALVVGEPTG